MTQSTAIKDAADRLQRALRALEDGLDSVVARVKELETMAAKVSDFEADRSDLVRQLDDAKAREAEFSEKEKEFSRLARESQQELDAVISEVMSALGGG